MKIVLAKSAGFCFGVRSAVDRISKSLRKHPRIQIDGDLIHNPQTTAILAQRGLEKTELLNEVIPVAIRTHGTTSLKLKQIYCNPRTTYNLTCPKVSRIQGLIRKYSRNGYYVLLIGDDGHPEVVSLKSYAESGITVIKGTEDLASVPRIQKMILISQTTIDRTLFDGMKSRVLSIAPECIVFDTICDSTGNKQSELREAIDKGADTVIVIGGKHSANTKSLASIAQESGIRTLHIETADEFSPSDLVHSHYVFVTAGASTPDWAIQDTLVRLRDAQITNRSFMLAGFLRCLDSILYLNIPAASCVFFLFFSSIKGIIPAFAAAAITTALFAMAELFLIPFTIYSDRKRAVFWSSPSAFIKKGSFAEHLSAKQIRSKGLPAQALRLAAVVSPMIIAAAYHQYLTAAAVLTMLTAGIIMREHRDAGTDLVTGKFSFVSDSVFFNAGFLLILAAMTGICTARFHFLPSREAGIILLISLASYPDFASYYLCRREMTQAWFRTAELFRAAIAAAAGILIMSGQ